MYFISLLNPASQVHHGKVVQLATWDTYSYAGEPGAASGSPGTTKETIAGPESPGPGLACPWAQALAASFVVPGDPKAAPGSPVYEHGSQVANLKNLSMVGILAKILMQIENRHGQLLDFAVRLCFRSAIPQSQSHRISVLLASSVVVFLSTTLH